MHATEAPGVAQGDIAKACTLPGPLVDAGSMRPRELYWLVRHGLKMTGMPAWEYRLADSEIWDVVAFMQHLPTLNATLYAQWQQRTAAEPVVSACGRTTETLAPTTEVDVQRGRQALHQYACTACHSIPGVTGPAAFVGPPLDRFATRG